MLQRIKSKVKSIFGAKNINPQKERDEYINPQKISFSQSGEDLIVDYIFKVRGLDTFSYLDIGANHPSYINNTYAFYLKGCWGVNIEPNPKMIEKFKALRPKDISIEAGASIENGELIYYQMETPELNTFSKEHAEYMVERGHTIIREMSIPVYTINHIIEHNFKGLTPNVIFIDAEGMDLVLLKSIDFDRFKPEVLCVESVTYETNGRGVKDTELIEYISGKDYMMYADTNINSIFVRKDFWLV
jgi:FkbM family methyltransferase